MAAKDIENLLTEERSFEPPASFAASSVCGSLEDYQRLYRESLDSPDTFWSRVADELHWFKKWDKVLDWTPPHAKWFVGGLTNISFNCLDRHLDGSRADKKAIIW
ncbi:MAG: acetyl-coenzyme A synthetase, partial [Gemmatimonadetes bacterium]|nr:acetyl-coenzyme A synthetase [Gemmatimonadota bacterium]